MTPINEHGKDGTVTERNGQGGRKLPGAAMHGGKDAELDLAIVGGGFSGLCTAYHLCVNPGIAPGFRCAIVEAGDRVGAGVAYRTDSPHHLLNVRARGMSITEDDPGSFVRWLQREAPRFSADDFVPRGLYRRYTTSCLERAAAGREAGALTLLRDTVIAVEPGGEGGCYRLRLASGGSLRARAVVLALGNLPPRSPLDQAGLLRSPWRPFEAYGSLKTLAVVGAGLTALDVILEAEASGFSGRYAVVSPHGRFPRAHREPHTPVPQELRRWAEDLAAAHPRLRELLRAFREKRKGGADWQHLVDAFRRHSPTIWAGFDPADKRRFLCHLRTIWNTHLHRSCHRSMQVVSRLGESGRLRQIAACVVGVEKRENGGDWGVRLLLKGAPPLDTDLAFDGTGLFSDVTKTDSPLVAQLIGDRLAVPDDFRLGFKVNGIGQLMSADGTVRPDLFTVGTLRRGTELECTAVPEIRRQVSRLVEEIVRMGRERD